MKVSALSILALAGTASAFVSNSPATSRSDTRLFERKPFITGNWKLNPSTKVSMEWTVFYCFEKNAVSHYTLFTCQDEAIALASGIAAAVTPDSPCDVALFVPFPFIEAAQEAVGDKLTVGAEVSRLVLMY